MNGRAAQADGEWTSVRTASLRGGCRPPDSGPGAEHPAGKGDDVGENLTAVGLVEDLVTGPRVCDHLGGLPSDRLQPGPGGAEGDEPVVLAVEVEQGQLTDAARRLDRGHGIVHALQGGALEVSVPDQLVGLVRPAHGFVPREGGGVDRKSTRLNSSHVAISYAVLC